MQKYRVIGRSVMLAPGYKIELDDKQLRRRAFCVKKSANGEHELLATTHFKKGEVFGYSGSLNLKTGDVEIFKSEPKLEEAAPKQTLGLKKAPSIIK